MSEKGSIDNCNLINETPPVNNKESQNFDSQIRLNNLNNQSLNITPDVKLISRIDPSNFDPSNFQANHL